MQLSAFNLYADGFPGPGQTLVHNTFSGGFATVETEVVRRALAQGEIDPAALDGLDGLDGLIDDLADPDVGVVVESRADEQREYQAWFDERCKTDGALRAIVCVNLACNFACSYCCQADVMDGKVMDGDTAARTASWLAARAHEVGAGSVHVTFIGGEPLLHPDRVADIARRIRDGLGEDGPRFTMGLITNGYFLTEEVVLALLPLGLVGAKITLDGDQTTHATTRISKRGEDTFQRIFDNALAANRHIKIAINGNYQDDTIAGFGPLVDKLAAAGLARGSDISFSPALEALDSPEGSGSGACSWSESDNHGYQVALYDEVLRHGFAAPRLLSAGPCSFHNRDMYAIGPDGTIYKCPGFLGHTEWGVGTVRDGLNDLYRALTEVDTQESCGGCAHRPNCAGGCVAHEYVKRGRPEGVNCERGYLDAVTSDGMIRDYLLATAGADEDEAVARFPRPPRALPARREQPAASRSPAGRGVRPAALRVI